MATITSVNNNTTAGAIYSVHDPATWIGGVVPGPNDVVVLQSSQATRWQITQDWTIQNLTMSASSSRSSGSYLEFPSTITNSSVTFTQTAGSWITGTWPTVANAGELPSAGQFLLINNPTGTTVTCNIPGGIQFANGTNFAPDADSYFVKVTAQGNVYINTPYLGGFAVNAQSNWRYRNAIHVTGAGGYTEVNVTGAVTGLHNYAQCYYLAALMGAFAVNGLAAGGNASVRLNCNNLAWSQYGTCWNDQQSPAVNIDGNLGTAANAVTINVTGAKGWNWYRGSRAIVYCRHTAGNIRLMGADIQPSTGATETWPTIGYNENLDAGGGSGLRQIVRQEGVPVSASNRNFISIYCNVYSTNNIYSTQSSTGSWTIVSTGGGSIRQYGNVYTSPKHRFQVPFYFDSRQSFFYQMAGTIYTSINHVVYFNTLATNNLYPVDETPGVAAFSGGVYFGNTVAETDIVGNIYAVNANPFICPNIAPNPFYQAGAAQIQRTYRRHFDDRTTTSSMIAADYTDYSPQPADVRLGTVYGGGSKVGTLAVPQPYQVAYGVATDATVGTWTGDFNVVDVTGIADVIWNYNLSNATNTSTGAARRLLNTATVESTGNQIAALGV